ncbi:hypothetical protein [Halorussus halobius]|uniref:hypothetical protein n=1 Tax=Halorussus halobius TaxID=1710537 RepID=UPI0010931BA4|nr:hypothetical protein [Halorussus halobius]
MVEESASGESSDQLTKAERTAREGVQRTVEGVVSADAEWDAVVAIDSTISPVLVAPSVTTTPTIVAVAGVAADASVESVDEEVVEDLEGASADALVEARRDLT